MSENDDPITLEEIDRRIAAALEHFAATLIANNAPEDVRAAALQWAREELEFEWHARREWLLHTREWLERWRGGGSVQ